MVSEIVLEKISVIGKSSASYDFNIWCKNQSMENNESKTEKELDRQAPDHQALGFFFSPLRSLVDEMSSETSPFNSSIKSSF